MTDSRNDEVAPLQVLAILEDGEAKAAIQRAAQVTADVVSFSGTLEDGLDHAQAELPDVVFLEVTLSEAAGVALVHHHQVHRLGLPVLHLLHVAGRP